MRRVWRGATLGVIFSYVGCSDDPTDGNASPVVIRDAASEQSLGGGASSGTAGRGGAPPTTTGGATTTPPSAGGAGGLGGAASTGGREAGSGNTTGRDGTGGLDGAAGSTGGRDGSLEAGVPEAGVPDGGPDAAVPSCVQVDGGAGWPPSPWASTNPECIVNCDADQCGSACTSGMPCDSGCCSTNQVSLYAGEYSSPSSARRATMVRDSTGTLYGLQTEGGVYWEHPATGPGYYVSNLDCQNLVNPPPEIGGGPYCADGAMFGSQWLAVGGPPGQRIVYAAYGGGFAGIPPRFRFGTKSGTQWTFEDLSLAPRALAADPAGTAWMSSEGKLYRRNAASGWDPYPVPCGVSVESLAFDDSGALYISQKNQIWRRDPNGSWAVETVPANVQRIYTGAGTVHYLGATPGFADNRYGRRLGTTWSDYRVSVSFSPDYGFDAIDMALDGCGAPHFAISGVNLNIYNWELFYLRWTATGWHSGQIYRTLDPPGAAIGVGSNNAEIVFYAGSLNGDYPVLGSGRIPLK